MSLPKLNRVLVTGQIEKLPEWLNEGLEERRFCYTRLAIRTRNVY